MASDRLMAVLPAIQKPGLKILVYKKRISMWNLFNQPGPRTTRDNSEIKLSCEDFLKFIDVTLKSIM